MERLELGVARVGSQIPSPLHGLLGFDGEFVESKCHIKLSSIGYQLSVWSCHPDAATQNLIADG